MPTPNTRDFLIPGHEYVQEDFILVGRDKELADLIGVLMRQDASNALVVGAGGVGCSALCMGLQAKKRADDAPLDLVGRRLFWLDTDGLFASGDYVTIDASFKRLMAVLSRTESRDTVLVIEDARVFIEATRANNCSHFINSMMRELNLGRFQLILETRDQDLDFVLKAHADILEMFTMVDVLEPKTDGLREILLKIVAGLESHHGIAVDDEAIDAAIDLSTKYRTGDASLTRAQPDRAANVLDRALASYRQDAHSYPPALKEMDRRLEQEQADDMNYVALVGQAAELKTAWEQTQSKLRQFAASQRQGEDLLIQLEDELSQQLEDEKGQQEQGHVHEEAAPAFNDLSERLDAGGIGSPAVMEIRRRIEAAQLAVNENRGKFDALTRQVNESLALGEPEVLAEFSAMSGIAVDKLNEDERAKLLNLDNLLKDRVYGQDHAMDALANAVRVARAGLNSPEKPMASFLFLGPSGVGKTETGRALAAILKGDENALFRLDMSEYMEKHSVARMIGAPPGYDGFEHGGILTNAVRANPHRIILFDEIEKAHPDVFNVLLQVLDAGRLTDNRGLTVNFNHCVILMTTNLGQQPLLDDSLSFEQASAIAMEELEEVYRPEFLNRFDGRQSIIAFKRLGLDIVTRIAEREIVKLNQRVASRSKDLSITIDADTLHAICESQYAPAVGARKIAGFFATKIYPAIATQILGSDKSSGTMKIAFDGKDVSIGDPEGTL